MKNQKGFTLIELLLVLAIIGIIAAIAIPALLGQREKAKTKAVNSMVANVTGECARVNDALKEQGSDNTPADVITAVLALSNYQYPAAKNPYGGSSNAYIADSPDTKGTGNVYLLGDDKYEDPATKATYPAVVVTGVYKGGTTSKVVALD